MSILNLRAGYFSIENPLRVLERWQNRYRSGQTVRIDRRKVEVRWTGRAERALRQRHGALIVEIRLYHCGQTWPRNGVSADCIGGLRAAGIRRELPAGQESVAGQSRPYGTKNG